MRHPAVRLSIGFLAIGLFAASIFSVPAGPAQSRERDRSLKLYFTHTGERAEIVFKRNGRYDRAGLEKINKILRDWRRNEPTRMDPQLIDLIWAIYQQAGGRDYIHVVSAYRSLATNNMLRSRSRGVAEKSQHTAGKAMDFFIPGVPLSKLRATALKFQGGGVGYYPSSGSPFVHVDTGSVRYWPRMTRQQLLALFPNGETLYVPADGKPLQGYERALARRPSSGGTTSLAYLETGSADREGSSNGTVGGWLKRVFDGGADEAEDNEATGTAAPPPRAATPPRREEPARTASPARPPAAARSEPPALAPATPPARTPVPAAPPAVPLEEPAIGEPTTLIAAVEPGLDPRLPRSRPAPASDTMLAALPTEPADTAAADEFVVATLAFAPLPRSRPDSVLLADSLRGTDGALSVKAEDAIAALTARAEETARATTAPPEPMRGTSGIQVAFAPAQPNAAEPSAADRAILAGFAAIEEPTAAIPAPPAPAAPASALAAVNALGAEDTRVPRPRPLALAFTGAGLASDPGVQHAAVAPVVAAQAPSAPVEQQIAALPPPAPVEQKAAAAPSPAPAEPRIAAIALPAQEPSGEFLPAPEPTYVRSEQTIRDLIVTPSLGDGEFPGFAMPQPASMPDLFTAPATAGTVSNPPAAPNPGRFVVGAAEPAPQEESFFSRLFASLAE